MSIEEILASGDPDDIEALMGDMEVEGDGEIETDDTAADEAEQDVTEPPQPEAEPEAQAEEGQQEGAEQGDVEGQGEEGSATSGAGEEEQRPPIAGKHGNHTIPYEVLEQTRDEARQYRDQAQQAQQELDQFRQQQAEQSRLLEVLKGQLQRNNLEPEDLPENIKFSDEQLQQLEEDYGELGATVRVLARQNEMLRQQVASNQPQEAAEPEDSPAADPQVQPVEAAIQANEDLSAWRDSDPDRWEMAVSIDTRLRQHPDFQNSTFEERFAEVARRTKAAFGDALPDDTPEPDDGQAKAKAQAVIDQSTPATPQTLSDVGKPPATERSLVERVGDMDVDEIASAMSGMNDDQIDELLAQAYE